MTRRLPIIVSCVVLGTSPTLAQSGSTSPEKITVGSLLGQDYAIVGTVQVPSGGVGLFMRKTNTLYACFVSETPQSAKLSTRYCKPVE